MKGSLLPIIHAGVTISHTRWQWKHSTTFIKPSVHKYMYLHVPTCWNSIAATYVGMHGYMKVVLCFHRHLCGPVPSLHPTDINMKLFLYYLYTHFLYISSTQDQVSALMLLHFYEDIKQFIIALITNINKGNANTLHIREETLLPIMFETCMQLKY